MGLKLFILFENKKIGIVGENKESHHFIEERETTVRTNRLISRAPSWWVLFLVLIAAFFAFLPVVHAQVAATPKLAFKYDLSKGFAKTNIIELRPNTSQKVYLFVKNVGPNVLKDVTVKLMKVKDDGTVQQVAQTKVALVDSNKAKRIIFAKKEEKKPDTKETADKKKKMAKLPGPPFEIQVWFVDRNNKTYKEMLPVRVKIPSEYVGIENVQYDAGARRMTAFARTKASIYGEPTQVRLILRPDLIPGLSPIKTAGVYRQLLPQPKEPVPLVAAELKFRGEPPRYGRVYFEVDGYQRAYLYTNSFTEGNPKQMKGTRLRVVAPRYATPGPKLPIRVEVDLGVNDIPRQIRTNVTDERPKPLRLVAGLDLAGTKQFFATNKYPGQRQQTVFFKAGPELEFQTLVKDWVINLDATELFGQRTISAQLQAYNTATGKYEPVAIVKEQLDPAEQIPWLEETPEGASRFAPLVYRPDQAIWATITLDGSPPEITSFGDVLAKKGKLVRGAPILVTAKGNDPQSDIRQVIFFTGKPGPKDEIPKESVKVLGSPVAGGNARPPQVWLATLPLATDKAGKFDIGVRFTNGAGLSKTRVITLKLVEPDSKNGKGEEKSKGAKITGKVVEGGLAQANIPVSLTTPKGELKGFAKTNAAGVFTIKNVEPGTYALIAAKSATRTSGRRLVQVPEGVKEVKGADIKLTR